jgi:hypothetical protein
LRPRRSFRPVWWPENRLPCASASAVVDTDGMPSRARSLGFICNRNFGFWEARGVRAVVVRLTTCSGSVTNDHAFAVETSSTRRLCLMAMPSRARSLGFICNRNFGFREPLRRPTLAFALSPKKFGVSFATETSVSRQAAWSRRHFRRGGAWSRRHFRRGSAAARGRARFD